MQKSVKEKISIILKSKLLRFIFMREPQFCELRGTRTPNLLVRSQMLYPLSYKSILKRVCKDIDFFFTAKFFKQIC